jgi:hypothetical protein
MPEEESYYDLPNRSQESATLYQHCMRAIEHGLKFGEHGLPLMGSGDWNDGMNLVGKEGRGESVWLAFFLYDVLTQFAGVARGREDATFAERCLAEARQLQKNIEEHAWDGQWYLRAYFDNGEPLGSKTNSECQIDSIPQSWSVISGAGESARSRLAMQAVNARGNFLLCSIPCNTARRRSRSRSTKWNLTSWQPTSMPSLRTSVAAVGHGTPDQPAGCTGSSLKLCSASISKAIDYV